MRTDTIYRSSWTSQWTLILTTFSTWNALFGASTIARANFILVMFHFICCLNTGCAWCGRLGIYLSSKALTSSSREIVQQFSDLFFIIIYMYLCVCVCGDVCIWAQMLVDIRRDCWISSSWSYRLHNVSDGPNPNRRGAGNTTQVLCQSSMYC